MPKPSPQARRRAAAKVVAVAARTCANYCPYKVKPNKVLSAAYRACWCYTAQWLRNGRPTFSC